MRIAARLTFALSAAAGVLIAAAGHADQGGIAPEQIETFIAAFVYLIRATQSGGPWVMGLAVLGMGANIAWLIYWLPHIVKPLASAVSMVRRGSTERELELEQKLAEADRKIAQMEADVRSLQHQVEEQATLLREITKYVDPKKLDPDILARLFGGPTTAHAVS
ncbi:hypothetical protein [Azospirillum canadense]|uniref:hypothetical protein n=1 Tax=Azospirillum canadense TaxID=403962 RepID=UPI0022270B61|nr:hypothetical protein [Azospirillum canadense]MCW2242255.1 Sec-independent protein translocase protein TatA [Azospirillum canadense]